MDFSDLGLSPEVLKAVEEAGYTAPTPIQEQAIPVALEGGDLLGIAQTGTGKTASFTLPMINMLAKGRARARMPRTLILEPTRELAAQVAESFEKYGKYHKLTMALLIGGVSFDEQDRRLDRGADVLIATPGRLLDHFERGKLLLTGVQIMVVDEADRMLDMGFIPDIERIFKLVTSKHQTLFFSATMPPEIQRLTDTFLTQATRIEAAPPASPAETVSQHVVRVRNDDKSKRDTLRKLIRSQDVTNAIIFCNRKRDVAMLCRSLQSHNFNAAALHGDMDQYARMKTLDSFRNGEIQLLVASDVAARGLDIPKVSHVLNYDVPHHAEDYIHRIGRTGRAGREGHAFTLKAGSDSKAWDAIVKLIGNPVEFFEIEGAEAGSAEEDEAKPTRGRRRRATPRRDGTAEDSGDRADDKKSSPRAKKPGGRKQAADGSKKFRSRDKGASGNGTRASEKGVVGMGDHVPDFMRRTTRS